VIDIVRHNIIWTRAVVQFGTVSRGDVSEYQAMNSSRRSKATTVTEDKARMIIASVCIRLPVMASDCDESCYSPSGGMNHLLVCAPDRRLGAIVGTPVMGIS
jgi:hypothetical protein